MPEMSEEVVKRLQTLATARLSIYRWQLLRYRSNCLAGVIEGASETTREMCALEPCDNCDGEVLLGPKLQQVREMFPDWPALCPPCALAVGMLTGMDGEDIRIADELL